MQLAEIKKPQEKAASSTRVRKVPKNLIWETLNGQPLYRRGYKDVMRKTKTIEEIMGSSSLQALIHIYLLRMIIPRLDFNIYDVLASEIGVHFDKNDNISNDLAIYRRLSASQISRHYTDFPAKIVIDIDIDIDPDSMRDLEYLTLKTQKMLDFGVEKVIWVLTNIKKIMIATPENAWQTTDWSQSFEIMEGMECNVLQFLEERGVS